VLHLYLPLPQISHSLTALPLSSQIKYKKTDKISKLRLSVATNPTTSSPHLSSPPATPADFSSFIPASEFEIFKIFSNCPNKQSDSYPILTWLLQECVSVRVPTITNITKSLLPLNLHICITLSLFSLPVALALHLFPLYLIHLPDRYTELIVPFDVLHLDAHEYIVSYLNNAYFPKAKTVSNGESLQN